MKQERILPKARVTRKAENSIKNGHPWIYDTEVTNAPRCENGLLTDVFSDNGKYLGTGFYNDNSKIRIRLISRNANDTFDREFWKRRIKWAWDYRKTVMGGDLECCRVIFGEADFFPGLTVDRFGDILVTQTLSLGIERIKHILFPLLYEVLTEDGQKISGIYERNDVKIRELEGMEQGKGFFDIKGINIPESTKTEITENGIKYEVDFENGQKTGFFLDQKYNRASTAKICRGKRVLDCFTHTGSFGLNAAKAGALHVHSVDISEEAIRMAEKNAVKNGFDNVMSFEAANVFDLLPTLTQGRKSDYDVVILDPPAFTKSRRTIEHAARGYKEINMRAMKLLPRGGYLATCSCSHFMTEQLFCSMIKSAATDADVSIRQVEARQQSPDHPILWNVPETNYLKFFIFQIV